MTENTYENKHINDPLCKSLKVLFIHGGGYAKNRDLSKQPFAKYLESHFDNTHIEHMTNTGLFEVCIRQQAKAIVNYKPDLIVCKSQGGPTLFQLWHRKIWHGPSILCCPAVVPGIDNLQFIDYDNNDNKECNDVSILIVNGSKDVAVPMDRIESILSNNKIMYQNNLLRKVVVNDDHGLLTLLDDDNDTHLFQLIKECWNNYINIPDHIRRKKNKFCIDTIPPDMIKMEDNQDWFNSSKPNHVNNDINKNCCIIL